MKTEYQKRITDLLGRTLPRLSATHELSFKNVFGAVGGYVDGNIFVTSGRFGLALRLPSETVTSLLAEKGVQRLKYFPNGHVKKNYAVLPGRILQDQDRMKKLIRQSMRFAVRKET